jgi:hypothetical protein
VTVTRLDALRNMRKLLSDPATWIKGDYAVNKDGECIRPEHPDACQFCVEGARMRSVAPLEGWDCVLVFRQLTCALPNGFGNIPAFNDHPDTKHEDVLALIDRAIKKEEESGGS